MITFLVDLSGILEIGSYFKRKNTRLLLSTKTTFVETATIRKLSESYPCSTPCQKMLNIPFKTLLKGLFEYIEVPSYRLKCLFASLLPPFQKFIIVRCPGNKKDSLFFLTEKINVYF